LGKTEVTFDQWNACVAGGGCTSNPKPDDRSWGRGRRPVINVSHRDAQEYVAWLSKTTAQSYRLPSEAEWEYGYRAGSKEPYPFKDGKTITVSQARYAAGCTVEVGSYLPNKFGLHDMPGNVSEWVEDAWHESYRGAPTDGSVWWRGGDPKLRVVRGGAWYHSAIYLRSTDRVDYTATYTYGDLGFRVARDLKPGELSK
jgi:formylglycine-generating enzyme required for sulfatase activity